MENNGRGAIQDRLWTKDFILMCLSNLTIFSGLQVLLPTLPVYVNKVGGDEKSVGLVIGVFTIAAMIIRPISGMLLDRIGRKGIFFLGTGFFALTSVSYGLATSVFTLLLIRLVHGVSWSIATTASGTVVTDLLPKSRLGEGMGYFGLMAAFSMAVAPAIGLWIIQHAGFTTLFAYSAICGAVSLGAAMAVRYVEVPQADPSEQKNTASAFSALSGMFEPKAFRASTVMLFLTSTFGSIVSFIALFAAENGITNIGMFFSAYAVTIILSRPFIGKLVDRRGVDIVMIPGLILVAVSMIIVSRSTVMADFLMAGFGYGLGMGATMPALQALAVRDVLPQRRGAANGTFFAALDLGIGVGAMAWGVVAELVGYRWMYLLATIPIGLAAIIYLYSGKKSQIA